MMASKAKRKGASTSAVPSHHSLDLDFGVSVLHEGWCTKESGTTFLGKTNWRRRWFKLVEKKPESRVLLQYFRNRHDRRPAGSFRLDATYCTRQLESHEKPHPNCFAVGPLIDDGATRTYYISCSDGLAMREWVTVIDAAIQGVPEQARARLRTVTNHYSVRRQKKSRSATPGDEPDGAAGGGRGGRRSSGNGLSSSASLDRGLDLSSIAMEDSVDGDAVMEDAAIDDELERDDLSDDELCENAELSDDDEEEEDEDDVKGAVGGASAKKSHKKTYRCAESSLKPSARLVLYDNQQWRMEHWKELCLSTRTLRWSKRDCKDGITVSRCKFGRSSRGFAVMKVEGVLAADPDTVYNFLKISTRQGGKLDYIFRNETLLDEIEEDPQATIIYNHFLLPLPRVSKRDVVAMKMWIPQYLTGDDSCGMVMFSVDHPQAPPPDKDARIININTSGVVLRLHPGPKGELHTHTTIIVRVALYGALHRILKGAYNSGLLKLGMRTTFQHIQDQLQRFIQLTDL